MLPRSAVWSWEYVILPSDNKGTQEWDVVVEQYQLAVARVLCGGFWWGAGGIGGGWLQAPPCSLTTVFKLQLKAIHQATQSYLQFQGYIGYQYYETREPIAL